MAKVIVTLGAPSIEVGKTAAASVSMRDSANNELTGRVVTWSSSNVSVATIDTAAKLVTGVAQGTANIIATSEGVTGQTPIIITQPAPTQAPPTQPPPPPPSSSVQPLLVEDFSTYTSTANMVADPRNLYIDSEDLRTSDMVLDTQVGYGTLTRSMRYDFAASGSDRVGYTISRGLSLPSTASGEVWFEVVAKWSPNFSLDAGAPGGKAYKFLLVGITGAVGRFGLDYANNNTANVDAEGPNDNYDAFYIFGGAGTRKFDNNWHVFRYHIRLGSPAMHEYWTDGVLKGRKSGTTAASRLNYIALGKNLNQGPLQAQSMWIGKVTIWDKNPGWQ